VVSLAPAPVSPLAVAGGPRLVLASGSPTRRALLAAAGVPVAEARASRIDEAGLRVSLWEKAVVAERTATILAEHKAADVGRQVDSGLVIGADQILETAAGTWPAKPQSRAEAREQLLMLRGARHRLVSAAVLVENGVTVWTAVDVATLTMRDFDTGFLDSYLDALGDAVTTSVGGYHLEGMGVQLFSTVEGGHFTILGLPLLPLLEELRTRKVLLS